MAACAMHYDMDFGLVMCYLGGEYDAKWRDVEGILDEVSDSLSTEDQNHIHCILIRGCPVEFNWEEWASN